MKPVLITIPISHYCEKARWALDYAQIDYTEKRHLQLFHALHTLRAGRTDSVPLLLTSGGVLKDSTDILKWVNAKLPSERKLYPDSFRSEVETLEDEFDERFGVAGRLWMYTHMLDSSQLAVVSEMAKAHAVPRHEQALLPLAFPLMQKVLARMLGVTEKSRSWAKERVDRTFDRVAERLKDGRPYLLGDRFTAADLTFAALSAAVLLPESYGVALPELGRLPAEMREQVLVWRKHPAAKFALALYATARWPKNQHP